ncbi:MAG TPA: Na+/H+ antiporter NhaC family protein [Clostridia bacterium]|nr:Na+/H+ antiporter NhaC family protein [Clostridia bacterium]
MLFNMSPLVALLPLIVYIILAFRDINPILNVLVCVILSAVLTNHSLLSMGGVIANSLGSFLALIGLIIMLGSALGQVLRRTGVAENLVITLMKKIGINTEKKAILASMITSVVLVALLGTLAGANAIIAPIIIPLVSVIGITPSALAVVFQGAGQTGLFIGPFAPPVVTIMELTGLTYVQFLFAAGLPVALICWIITYFMAVRTQKKTKGIYSYDGTEKANTDYVPTKEATRATWAFLISITALLIYGMYAKSGASYAVVVTFTIAIVTGIAGGLKMNELLDAMMEGAGRMIWLFVMFLLFDPLLLFIEEAGAFNALVEVLQPLLQSGSKIVFSFISVMTGVYGISGAAVAQSMVMDKMFKPLVDSIGLSASMWAAVLLVGSQMTSFAYPGADMLGQMGLARSKDLKSMIKFGVTLALISVIFVVVKSIFLA